jgi:hypothetical protein
LIIEKLPQFSSPGLRQKSFAFPEQKKISKQVLEPAEFIAIESDCGPIARVWVGVAARKRVFNQRIEVTQDQVEVLEDFIHFAD